MVTTARWTSADLALLQHDDKRYEIIDGDLYVSTQPSWDHQQASVRISAVLHAWSEQYGVGEVTQSPGLIFADDNDVAPDVVWASDDRVSGALDAAGHLHAPPELVVEILSPGAANEQRDREVKRRLYSRRGVDEYWIADPHQRTIAVYRREDAALHLVATLRVGDTLESPLLPGFYAPVERLFRRRRSDP